jgi:D-aspartate ligase
MIANDPANVPVARPRRDFRRAVVVMNMHYTGLGVARALAGTTADVWGLSFDSTSIGNASRYCKFAPYPNPAAEPTAAIEFLTEFAARFEQQPLLIPTRDLDLEFLLRHRDAVSARYALSIAPSLVMDRILDKSQLFATARSIGITCPHEVRITGARDLRLAREEIALPCIVKPVVASRWRHGAIHEAVGRRKVVVFDNWADVQSFYERVAPLDPELLVQEYIPGDDRDLEIFGSYIARDGAIRWFTARKILQSPPGSGTGIVVRAEPIADIVAPSTALLRALGYVGISEIEFKRDARTGKIALIEVNPRHWDQHAVGAAAGVNLSRALYADFIGDPVPEMHQSAEMVSWIAEEGYLLGLADVLRGHNYPLAGYLGALRGRRSWATLSLRDPQPGTRMVRRVATEYARGVYNRLRRDRPIKTEF